jgi:beta-glucanase (GH16 family)
MKKLITIGLCLAAVSSVFAQEDKKLKLVWSDEFNYTGLPDSTKWIYENGFIRNDEPQYYTVKRKENCRVENGTLILEARKEKYANAFYKTNSSRKSDTIQFAEYTSASITTENITSWKYGRIEMSAKVPGGKGSWPAFWMLGERTRPGVYWPEIGEIDILEFLGRYPSTVFATVHYQDSLGKYAHFGKERKVVSPVAGFHTYALEWNPDRLEFYFDKLKYFVFDTSKSANKNGNSFQNKFFMLLNLALGHKGSWAGELDESALPYKYYVDYVRVYERQE